MNSKKCLRFLVFPLIISLLLPTFTVYSLEDEHVDITDINQTPSSTLIDGTNEEIEQISPSTFTLPSIDDDFSDNEIIIVVQPEYNYTEYTAASFSEINCIAIKQLSRKIIENELSRIITLTIEGHSKQNVISAIELLMTRDDIYSAEPNYSWATDISSNDNYINTNSQWAINAISLPQAWDVTTGGLRCW